MPQRTSDHFITHNPQLSTQYFMSMELPFPSLSKMVVSVLLMGLLGLFLRLYNAVVVKPERLRSMLKKQGVNGPPPSFLLGNIEEIKKTREPPMGGKSPAGGAPAFHNCAALLFPFFDKWRKQYGQLFRFSLGNIQILYVARPDIVREITTCTSSDFGKPSYQQKELGPLLGQGILSSNGAAWAHQRKILAPELYIEKVKGMVNLITESTNTMMDSWKSRIDETESGVADMKIDESMRSFSGDVISRACFGSNFLKGQEIFSKLRALQEIMAKKNLSFGIPGARYLPTKSNRETWALEKEVRSSILKVVKERKEASDEQDLLQKVLEGAASSNLGEEATDRFVVDNCMNIYLAGFETTAISATWCFMLLASNQEWQARVRAEVLKICEGQVPDFNMIRKMKQLTMVIQETLRLYSPATVMSREAFKDMKLGDIHVPKGVNLWTMALQLHTDPEVWGPDAYKFNPERFVHGISGACKFPHVYMPFGIGSRVCLGQNLAMLELKILIALAISNFSFSLSPKYAHSPILRFVVEPGNGVDLLVRRL